MTAGTAQAATTGEHGLTAVAGGSVEQLVGGVGGVAGDLTAMTRMPAAAGTSDVDAATEQEPPKDDAAAEAVDAQAATRPLTAGIDELTTLATRLQDTSALASDHGTTSAVSGLVVPASMSLPGTTSERSVDTDNASAGQLTDASAHADGPSAADATHRTDGARDEHAHAPAAAAPVDERAGAAASKRGAGDEPFQPFGPRALTSSTTSGSSAGGNAFEGGAGARITSFHVPYVARSVSMPALVTADVPWNPAGKPRVSPD